MNHPQHPIPLTILSGFLGAGKTTLLNHILRGDHGLRLMVLVNDFGSINIDAELLTGRDGDTLSLANGCICCSIGGDLMQALLQLLQRPVPPDHLIIEASGVSDPGKIAQIGLANRSFRLDGIITLADAESVREQAQDRYVGETVLRQLAAADLVVLNKLDLVDDRQRAEVLAWLHSLVPQAHVLEAVQARVPLQLLLGIGPLGDEAHQPHAAAGAGCAHAHVHDEHFARWSFTSARPFCGAALRAAIAGLPGSIIRGKGVLLLDEAPSRRTVFQMVGGRWELTPAEPWGERPAASRLVFIGLPHGIDAAALAQRFTAALADAESA